MRSRKGFFARLALALVLLAPGLLAAEVVPDSQPFEIEPPLRLTPEYGSNYITTAVTSLGANGFAAGWTSDYTPRVPSDFRLPSPYIGGRRVLLDGHPAERYVDTTYPEYGEVWNFAMARISEDRFVTVEAWEGDDLFDIGFSLFDTAYQPVTYGTLGQDRGSSFRGNDEAPSVASDGNGLFVIVWWRAGYEGAAPQQVMAQVFGSDGQPVTPEIAVTRPSLSASVYWPLAGMDAGGSFTVLWTAQDGTRGQSWGQRFDRAGHPVGKRFRMPGAQAMAMLPSGEFVAVWSASGPQNVLLLSRFTAEGQRIGPTVRLVRSLYASIDVSIAMDREGRLALAWRDVRGPALAVFDASLKSLGPVVFGPPGSSDGLNDQIGVAFGEDGRILTTWLGPWKNRGGRDSVLGMFWKVR